MTTPHQTWRVAPAPSSTEPGYAEVLVAVGAGWRRIHALTLGHVGAPTLLGPEWLRSRGAAPGRYRIGYFDREGGTHLGITDLDLTLAPRDAG